MEEYVNPVRECFYNPQMHAFSVIKLGITVKKKLSLSIRLQNPNEICLQVITVHTGEQFNRG